MLHNSHDIILANLGGSIVVGLWLFTDSSISPPFLSGVWCVSLETEVSACTTTSISNQDKAHSLRSVMVFRKVLHSESPMQFILSLEELSEPRFAGSAQSETHAREAAAWLWRPEAFLKGGLQQLSRNEEVEAKCVCLSQRRNLPGDAAHMCAGPWQVILLARCCWILCVTSGHLELSMQS